MHKIQFAKSSPQNELYSASIRFILTHKQPSLFNVIRLSHSNQRTVSNLEKAFEIEIIVFFVSYMQRK